MTSAHAFDSPWGPKQSSTLAERFTAGNSVVLHRAGAQMFDEMLATIGAATQSVDLEMYWFAADFLGRRFFDALAACASRGVEVRVLFDSFGSVATPERYFSALTQAGASVIGFNPISPLKARFHLARLSRRNHRKLLLTENCAFVGGANLAAHWLEPAHGGQGWRDDVASIRGPALQELRASFERSWEEAGGRPATGVFAPPGVAGQMQVAVLGQAHYRQRRQAMDAYLSRLAGATQSIFLSNAYFIPNRRIIRALIQARSRGVDVRIMLPARSDVEVVRLASRAVWTKLLQAGVRLYQWLPSILHSKSGVVDGEWSTVGSFNLDYISALVNSELNVSVLDAAFAQAMAASFLNDIEQCEEVSLAEFDQRTLPERIVERALYWFRERL